MSLRQDRGYRFLIGLRSWPPLPVGRFDLSAAASRHTSSGLAVASRLRPPVVVGFCIFTGLLAFPLSNPIAQQPAQQSPPSGKIHGRVISPTGQLQTGGAVSLSTDGGATLMYTFSVSVAGEYSGAAPAGEYTVVYRARETPEGKIVDYITGVVLLAGQDVPQDVDMTRREFIDRLSPAQQMQLEAVKAANAKAAATEKEIANNDAGLGLDADLRLADQDLNAALSAHATAIQILGTSAPESEIDAKSAEIEDAKYSEAEGLMTKDTAARPGDPALWIELARAQLGLRNFPDAETGFKKALELESKAKTPRPVVLGAADDGLGELYARSMLIQEANAAFDAAVKADPAGAARYLKDQAIVFFQEKNYPAQVDAADKAIKADPTQAVLYYIKAEGLAKDATFDSRSNTFVLPGGCADAFHKYLELAPNGPFAANVTAILQQAGEGQVSTGADNKK